MNGLTISTNFSGTFSVIEYQKGCITLIIGRMKPILPIFYHPFSELYNCLFHNLRPFWFHNHSILVYFHNFPLKINLIWYFYMNIIKITEKIYVLIVTFLNIELT